MPRLLAIAFVTTLPLAGRLAPALRKCRVGAAQGEVLDADCLDRAASVQLLSQETEGCSAVSVVTLRARGKSTFTDVSRDLLTVCSDADGASPTSEASADAPGIPANVSSDA